MEKKIVRQNGFNIAVINNGEPVITDTQSALDLMAAMEYTDQCERIVINKEAVAEAFFDLRTGAAGEILQKFVNYRKKLAVVGDFSVYESKALRDFIGECNRGNDFYFTADEEAAIEKLSHLSVK